MLFIKTLFQHKNIQIIILNPLSPPGNRWAEKMKEIKDYIGLYLNCEVFFDRRIWRMFKVSESIVHLKREGESVVMVYPHDCKPILRPLSSMTQDEVFHLFSFDPDSKGEIPTRGNITDNFIQCEYGRGRTIWMHASRFLPSQFTYLLSLGFDLFGLIESGLAIDSTTIKPATGE